MPLYAAFLQAQRGQPRVYLDPAVTPLLFGADELPTYFVGTVIETRRASGAVLSAEKAGEGPWGTTVPLFSQFLGNKEEAVLVVVVLQGDAGVN